MLEYKRTKIGDVEYSAGGLKYLNLPKDHAYLGLNIRLTGRLVISGGTTSGTPWDENPATLIERIRIYGSKAGGSVEIINIDPATLFKIMHLFVGTEYEKTAVSSGAAATYDFIQDIEVPFHVPRMADEYVAMSLLPGWAFDELQLEVKWREGASTASGGLISGGDRTLALTAYGSGAGNPSISVMGRQVDNIDPTIHNPVLFKLYKKTLVTESVESARKEPLNKGGFYRALLYKAYSDTAQRAMSNTILNNVKLLIGGNSKEDWPFMQLRAENKAEFSVETFPTGYCLFDFVPQGEPDTMLDTSDFAMLGTSLETELNISGAANNRVDIISMEVIPAGAW